MKVRTARISHKPPLWHAVVEGPWDNFSGPEAYRTTRREAVDAVLDILLGMRSDIDAVLVRHRQRTQAAG